MRDVFLILLAVGTSAGVAVITTYVIAEDAPTFVVVAEVLICFFGAIICGADRC